MVKEKAKRDYKSKIRTHWTATLVAELESAFRDGMNVSQACWQVNIGRDFFYRRCSEDPDFKDKMDKAQNHLSKVARVKVAKAINKGDMKTARWYLERRDKADFSTRTELTGQDGAPIVGLDAEEKTRLDNIWGRKHATPESTTNTEPGDDKPDDKPSGGAEDQGVS